MKNEPYNNLKHICLSGFLALLVCCCSVQARAQLIPIDSAFAEILLYGNPDFASCVSDYQLDTVRAKKIPLKLLIVSPVSGYPLSNGLKSLEGLQYFFADSTRARKTGAYLNISDNAVLSFIPDLPPVYRGVYIYNSPLITSLPNLTDSITELSIGGLGITSLQPFVNGIIQLSISNLQIVSLPALPDSLRVFGCSNTPITDLPAFPPKCSLIACVNNKISSMVNFPAGANNVSLGYNNISSLPVLNEGLQYLDLKCNPIACLPRLPASLGYLGDSSTNITCLPNSPSSLNLQLPLCANGCEVSSFGGRVFFDYNGNCIFDSTDIPAANRVVKLDSFNVYTISDIYGRYSFAGLPADTYSYRLLNTAYPYALNCSDSVKGIIYNGFDTIRNLDMPISILEFCARMTVDVGASFIASNRHNSHALSSMNKGVDTAFNAYILVKFDPELTPLSASPAWSQLLPDNTLRFDLGNVAPGQEFSFIIYDSTSITAPIGQTACVKAQVFPAADCATIQALWDSSHIEVQSRWVAGEPDVKFRLLNSGKAMVDSSEYRIYEEELLMLREKFKLKGMDSLIILVPANGHTYRLEADQRPGYPGLSRPRDFIELAGTPPYSLGYILDVPQDDADEWVEIDCHEIRVAYDPNAKSVYPAGVGASHYIVADDELEYIIQFQNTGNDTAMTVRVVDALDTDYLDISSFASGVSSHHYTVSISGNGVVTWTFANIMLPDSFRSEPASHGFVKFKIKQLPGNVPGTRINNFVDIYFDYNAPVRTNTAFVTIEEKENIFPMKVTGITEVDNRYSIQVMPNPFMQNATFIINTMEDVAGEFTFELLDVTGRSILHKKTGSSFVIERGDMVSGMYFFRIVGSTGLISSGKIIAR